MPDHTTGPRIPPLPPDERDTPVRELLDGAGSATGLPGADAANIFATLARHPGLLRRWLPFGGKLLT
ncbi:MAG TPA: carboxymuconolactone decarboxylase family protein, partial [Acidimicrobiia bacterium]